LSHAPSCDVRCLTSQGGSSRTAPGTSPVPEHELPSVCSRSEREADHRVSSEEEDDLLLGSHHCRRLHRVRSPRSSPSYASACGPVGMHASCRLCTPWFRL
jgi:hypothetical protein